MYVLQKRALRIKSRSVPQNSTFVFSSLNILYVYEIAQYQQITLKCSVSDLFFSEQLGLHYTTGFFSPKHTHYGSDSLKYFSAKTQKDSNNNVTQHDLTVSSRHQFTSAAVSCFVCVVLCFFVIVYLLYIFFISCFCIILIICINTTRLFVCSNSSFTFPPYISLQLQAFI